MTQDSIQLPDFDFTGFYFPQLAQALRQFGRINVPEITQESPEEPYIQLERAFALIGHLCNVNLDAAALESTLPTARTRQGVRNLLALIDYVVGEATPSGTEVVAELTKVFTTPILLIPAKSLFSTQQLPDVGTIFFETTENFTAQPTNLLTGALADDDGVFSDYTAEANAGTNWQPWGNPLEQNDAVYFGHESVMFDQINIEIFTAAADITTGVWEYYDGDIKDAAPDEVQNLGAQLEFDLTTLLGATNKAGALIRVTHLQSTAYEEVYSEWSGSKNYCTTGLLGQASPSEETNDYAVGTEWNPLGVITDAVGNLEFTGLVRFDLPQTLTEKWIKGSVESIEAFWIRFRIVAVGVTPTSPVMVGCSMENARHYALLGVVQGETITIDPLATSDGQPGQQYGLSHSNIIQGSITSRVGLQDWGYVDNFLSSTPASKDFTIYWPEDQFPIIAFGDGVNGRIPTLGEDIVVEYRIGADNNGNVGAQTIIVNSSGVAFLGQLYNPRPATGWVDKEGSTDEDRERLKLAGPADLRTRDRALNPEDSEVLAIAFVNSVGSKVVSRAFGIEESFGVKTIELVCVGVGGVQITDSDKDELEDYFNGNELAGIRGVLVLNHELTITDFQPRYITVEATVYGGNEDQIQNILLGLLHPEAKKVDGVTYEWDFGGEVPKSRIISEIFKVVGVRKVVLTQPTTDVVLATRELPLTTSALLSLTVEP